MIRVLRVIHDGLATADAMFAAFEEHGLIEPVMLRIALDDETRYNLPDCFTIGGQTLATLEGAALDRLNRAGFLALAFMVVTAMGNVSRIIELKNRKRRAAATGATRAKG